MKKVMKIDEIIERYLDDGWKEELTTMPLSYPGDVFDTLCYELSVSDNHMFDKPVILDTEENVVINGYHRLAAHYLLGFEDVLVANSLEDQGEVLEMTLVFDDPEGLAVHNTDITDAIIDILSFRFYSSDGVSLWIESTFMAYINKRLEIGIAVTPLRLAKDVNEDEIVNELKERLEMFDLKFLEVERTEDSDMP